MGFACFAHLLIGFCLQVPQLIFGPAEPDPPLTIIESPPPPSMAPEPEQLSSDKSEGDDVATAIQALPSIWVHVLKDWPSAAEWLLYRFTVMGIHD